MSEPGAFPGAMPGSPFPGRPGPDLDELLAFIEASERGFVK